MIGIAYEKWGETPLAVVVSKQSGLKEKQALEYCSGKIARYKMPKSVVFVDSLPLTATGKVQKKILKEQLRLF